MNLKSIVIFFFALLGSTNTFSAPAPELAIGGSYYQKIIQVKDVIAEVLPPPGYIVESYLVTFLLLNVVENSMSDKRLNARELKIIDKMAEQIRQLKEGLSENAEQEGYYTRVEIWNKELNQPDNKLKKIRELMIKSADGPVKEFFKIVEMDFIPAIKAGDISKAKKAQHLLNEKFVEHKSIIDEVVMLAKSNITEFEHEALKNTPDAPVKSPVYNKIMLMKDLISDVISPDCFIIESYLLGWEMVYEVERNGSQGVKFKNLIAESEKLKSAYIARHSYWSKNLKLKELRDVMVKDSFIPAQKFFLVFDNKLVPELKKGRVKSAKKTMNVALTSLFQKHRKTIDRLILKADNKAIEIESEMALQLVKIR